MKTVLAATVALAAMLAPAHAQGFNCTQNFYGVSCSPNTIGVHVYQDPYAASTGAAFGSILMDLGAMAAQQQAEQAAADARNAAIQRQAQDTLAQRVSVYCDTKKATRRYGSYLRCTQAYGFNR